MKIRGERILLIGDDYSQHGSGIWLVDQGSNRSSSSPGDLLASILVEQGAVAVQLDANPGRSSVSLWQEPTIDVRLASDIAFNPTQVIVFLGLNDLGVDTFADAQGFKAIKDAFPDAQTWAVGPPNFADPQLNTEAAIVYQTLASVFGPRNVIDLRLLTMDAQRSDNGIQFTGASAPGVAQALLQTLAAASPMSIGKAILWGAGIAALVGAGVWILRREKRTLDGLESVLSAAGDTPVEIEDPNVIDAEFTEKPAEASGLGRPMLEAPKETPVAMIRFASRDARSRFIDAYRKRLIEAGYEPHHAQDLVHAQLFDQPGLTAYISGTDDIDRVRDVASEVHGVMVKDRPDLDKKPQLDGAEDVPPEIAKKWKTKANAYKKALAELAAGSGDITKASRAKDALYKVADLASQHAGSWNSPLVAQINAQTDELLKEHTIADAEEQGRQARSAASDAEIKRLKEEEREARRPYEWMNKGKFGSAEPP